MTSLQVKNTNTIHEFLQTMVLEDNISMIKEIFVDDAIIHTSLGRALGAQGLNTHIDNWRDIFQGVQCKITNEIISESYISIHFTETCKHIGTYKSISATDKNVEFRCAATFSLQDDLISNYHVFSNQEDIISSLVDTADKKTQNSILKIPVLSEHYTSFFETIIKYLKEKNIPITFKQLENLCLWDAGKSDTEISKLLNISRKTVHYHQDKCKAAFRSYNKNQMFDEIKNLQLGHILHECYDMLMSSKLPNA